MNIHSHTDEFTRRHFDGEKIELSRTFKVEGVGDKHFGFRIENDGRVCWAFHPINDDDNEWVTSLGGVGDMPSVRTEKRAACGAAILLARHAIHNNKILGIIQFSACPIGDMHAVRAEGWRASRIIGRVFMAVHNDKRFVSNFRGVTDVLAVRAEGRGIDIIIGLAINLVHDEEKLSIVKSAVS